MPAGGPYNISTVSAGSDTPDPIEWANLEVKPAIDDLHLRSASLETNRFGGPTPKGTGERLLSSYSAVTAGSLNYATGSVTPIMLALSHPLTIDGIAVRVGTAQAINARVLLYNSDADGYPYMLAAEATFSCSVAALAVVTLAAPVLLPPGLYWGCIRSESGTTVRFTCVTPAYFGVQSSGATLTGERAITIDPGTYAVPTATLNSWGYADPGTTTVPWLGLVKAP